MNTELIKKAVAEAAENCGVKEYEVTIHTKESAGAKALKNEISSVSYALVSTMTVRCVVQGRSGYASSELVTPEAAAELVERACENAELMEEKDVVEIYKGSGLCGHAEKVSSSSADPKMQKEECGSLPDTETLKKVALELQQNLCSATDKIAEAAQSAASGLRVSDVFLNSAGLDLQYSCSLETRSVAAAVQDGNENADEHRIVCAGRESLWETAQKAVTEALSKLGADTVDSGKYDLILDKGTVRSLLGAFSGIFSAKSAYMKTTLYAGKEGQTVAAPAVSIVDDPFYPEKWNHCPFDGEGVAVYPKHVIENGVLNTLLYNRMYAKLLNRETTGNASDARNISHKGLYIAPGTISEEALLEKLGSGIYITALNGIHAGANAQTGDFSLQAEGFLVEDGKKTRPVKKFTIADNFYQLLKKVDAVADTVEFGVGSDIGAPEILVKGIAVAGK